MLLNDHQGTFRFLYKLGQAISLFCAMAFPFENDNADFCPVFFKWIEMCKMLFNSKKHNNFIFCFPITSGLDVKNWLIMIKGVCQFSVLGRV